VEITAGSGCGAARLDDNTVLAWGNNVVGECDVPLLPLGSGYTQIAAGNYQMVARISPYNTTYCEGDGTGVACPCANSGVLHSGCDNSIATGGARILATGYPQLSADTVELGVTGELPTSLSIVLQGNAAIAPVNFGDGLRCVGGILKRLYIHNAVGGALSVPQPGERSISARSAQLLDPIAPGSTRYYQVYYRDPSPSFCPAPQGHTFNVSNGIAIVWSN
jgi:hypothetical protein